MIKLAKLAMPLAALVLLTGCAWNTAEIAIASCDVGNHVTVGKGDVLTEPTAADIEKNNKSREAAGCAKPTPARTASIARATP